MKDKKYVVYKEFGCVVATSLNNYESPIQDEREILKGDFENCGDMADYLCRVLNIPMKNIIIK
jgi:hypothetical protein